MRRSDTKGFDGSDQMIDSRIVATISDELSDILRFIATERGESVSTTPAVDFVRSTVADASHTELVAV